MIVDCHVHLVPPGLARGAGGEEAWRPEFSTEGGTQLAAVAGRSARVGRGEMTSVEATLDAARSRGVDHILVAPWVQVLAEAYDSPADAAAVATAQNRAFAAISDPRVSALGTIPMRSPVEAVAELERVMASGLKGIEVGASVKGVFLGDDAFEPVWAAAERLGALVFIHPTASGIDNSATATYFLWNALGNPLETSLTAAQLVLAGVLDRHPALNFLLAHGGGAVTSLRGRLRRAWEWQPQARSRLTRPPDEALRGFLFDTVVYDAGVLAALLEFAGTERVLLGSDQPFEMAEPDALGLVRRSVPEPVAQSAISGGNAARLLNLDG